MCVGAMRRMLLVACAMICLPANAAVLTFSCDGTMKEEAQRKAHAITKMGLIVNSDAGVVTGFTGITAHIDEVNAKSVLFNGTTTHPSGAQWSVRNQASALRLVHSLAAHFRQHSSSITVADYRVYKSSYGLTVLTAPYAAFK